MIDLVNSIIWAIGAWTVVSFIAGAAYIRIRRPRR